LYSSPNIIRVTESRRMRKAGHVARIGEKRIQCTSWETSRKDNIQKDLQERGWESVDWIHSAPDKVLL
jgi:hypothetical protein